MTWDEIQEKYRRVALHVLGCDAPEEAVKEFMFRQILYKSCTTNGIIDSLSNTRPSVALLNNNASASSSEAVADNNEAANAVAVRSRRRLGLFQVS